MEKNVISPSSTRGYSEERELDFSVPNQLRQLPMIGLSKYNSEQRLALQRPSRNKNPFIAGVTSLGKRTYDTEMLLVNNEISQIERSRALNLNQKRKKSKISLNYNSGSRTDRTGIIRKIKSIKPQTVTGKMRDKIFNIDPSLCRNQIAKLKRTLAVDRKSRHTQQSEGRELVSSQSTRQISVPRLTSPRENSEDRREYLDG